MRTINLLVMPGLLPPPYGGIATYLAHTLPYLATHGFVVHALLPHEYGEPHTYAKFVEQGVHIHYSRPLGSNRLAKALRLLREPRVLLRNMPWFMRESSQSGLRTISFLKHYLGVMPFIDKTEKIIRESDIDIIHAYDLPWFYGFVAAHLASRYRRKFIQTVLGVVIPYRDELDQHDGFGQEYVPLVRSVLNRADLLVSLSQHCAREVKYVGVDSSKVRITHWGVDTKSFRPGCGDTVTERYALNECPVVLFVGQLRARKGPQILLEAVPQILTSIPSAKFLVIGPDFGMRSLLKQQIARLGLGDCVLMIDGIPQEELPPYYQASDVFVFPTCASIECLGLSMIQAMACGLPVVASDIDGIPEVLVDGATGWLARPGDPQDLANKIVDLLTNPVRSRHFGEMGRKRAEECFNRDQLVENLRQVYLEL